MPELPHCRTGTRGARSPLLSSRGGPYGAILHLGTMVSVFVHLPGSSAEQSRRVRPGVVRQWPLTDEGRGHSSLYCAGDTNYICRFSFQSKSIFHSNFHLTHVTINGRDKDCFLRMTDSSLNGKLFPEQVHTENKGRGAISWQPWDRGPACPQHGGDRVL